MAAKTQEEIYEKHHKISADIQKFLIIRTQLISQIHQKKCTLARNKYVVSPGSNTQLVYDNCLFLGRKGNNSFDPWPCEFKNVLGNLLFQELKEIGGDDSYGIDVYYSIMSENNHFRELQTKLIAVDLNEWNLDEGPILTHSDLEVIRQYVYQFTTFIDLVSAESQALPKDNLPLITREISRIRKMFESLTPVLRK